jgi:hypothetical protein
MYYDRQHIGRYEGRDSAVHESGFWEGKWYIGNHAGAYSISKEGEWGGANARHGIYFDCAEDAVEWFCGLPGAEPAESLIGLTKHNPKVWRSVPLF